jgi:hypothetical protein
MASTTLSKSRFKLALECPTKVFYSLDRRYVNSKDEDEFLAALADGGFQVGALAKAMYLAEDPAAVEVTVRDQDAQVRQSAELVQREAGVARDGASRAADAARPARRFRDSGRRARSSTRTGSPAARPPPRGHRP